MEDHTRSHQETVTPDHIVRDFRRAGFDFWAILAMVLLTGLAVWLIALRAGNASGGAGLLVAIIVVLLLAAGLAVTLALQGRILRAIKQGRYRVERDRVTRTLAYKPRTRYHAAQLAALIFLHHPPFRLAHRIVYYDWSPLHSNDDAGILNRITEGDEFYLVMVGKTVAMVYRVKDFILDD